MKWEKIEFGELYLIPSKNGLNRPSRVRGNGYKMINMGELFANDRIKDIPMELVPLNDREIESSNILEQDLLFARQSIVASGAGKCSIVLEVAEITTFESHLIRVRLNTDKANPLFYYYYFKTPFANMKSLVQQGVQAGIRGSELKNLSVFYPPLPTQRKIASILSAYDDLIENNLKRIKLLEEKAFLRYKQIVREEKLEEKSILDICYVTDGTHDSPKQQVDGFYLVTGKHLIGGFIDFSSAYFISEADHDKIQKRSKVVNGDLVLSNIGTIGNVAIIDSPFEFSVKNVIIFKPSDSVYTSFLYCYLNSDEMQTRFQQESSGTSQRFISLAYARALKVKLPSEDVLEEFHKEVSSHLKLKSILNQQNTKLREARNILLPKLMNGQIEV